MVKKHIFFVCRKRNRLSSPRLTLYGKYACLNINVKTFIVIFSFYSCMIPGSLWCLSLICYIYILRFRL